MVDFIALIPFDLFIINQSYINDLKLGKGPRNYKLIRMTKLLRFLRFLRERGKFFSYFSYKFGSAMNRLFFLLLSIICFCHIASCFWYLSSDLLEKSESWVIKFDYKDKSNLRSYIAALYWVTQTVVTTGYGDIHSQNTLERLIACFMMFGGVIFYSLALSSITSLLNNLDLKNAKVESKLDTLVLIKNEYNLNQILYKRIKRALSYEYHKTDEDYYKVVFSFCININYIFYSIS